LLRVLLKDLQRPDMKDKQGWTGGGSGRGAFDIFGLVSRPWRFVYGQQYIRTYYAFPPPRVPSFLEPE
jgi:hypothetical protein